MPPGGFLQSVMKHVLLTFLIVLATGVSSVAQPLSPRCKTLLNTLMMKFDSLEVYENRKLARIQMKKDECEKLEGREQMEALLDVAYEYSYFDSDSTISTLKIVAKMASDASDNYMKVKTAIRISRILTTLGYYKESSDIIDSINRKSIPRPLLFEYFEAKEFLCYELFHVDGSRLEFQDMYEKKYRSYMDSVILYAPGDSEFGLRSREKKALILNDYDYAMQCNRKRMELAPEGSIAESFVFYERNLIYEKMGGNEEECLYCLLRAAIIDLENSNQDVAAFTKISYMLRNSVDAGILDKFSEYSYSSMIKFRSRTRRILGMDVIVETDRLLRQQILEQKRQLTLSLALLSVLAVLLVGALCYMVALIRKGRVLTRRLERSNRISNGYIASFFQLYSSYIDRLLAFRGRINTSLRRGNTNYVIELTNPSRDITNDELRHMYDSFDSAFLDIFPTFVEDFNSLLKPECHIVLKESEKLNTELRIFAMIKLGVTESAKISELLHYSIKTVYNKRSAVNSKLAISKEKFERILKEL